MLALLAATGATRVLPASAASLQSLSVALDWTPNTNHIGLFVAREKGYYRDAGLDVSILPYGDTASTTLVANHVADFGIVSAVSFFTQRAAGADLKAIYAVVQSETGRLVYDAANTAIKTPRDLDGLRYGGFGSAWENALIRTIIQHAGGKGEFETITLGTSAYDALANHAVDFTLEVSTWEGVEAQLKGLRQNAFRYADYGVPDQHTTLIASSTTYLSANPKAAAAFTQATQRGYAFAVDRPNEAADILLKANSGFLTDPALVKASLKALNEGHFLRGLDGATGTIKPEKIQAIGEFLFDSGILLDADGKPLKQKPDFADYFTDEYFGAA
jgi:ABC-type nitrate/sulfonate/bicarbonate transport system substrate-binding protein